MKLEYHAKHIEQITHKPSEVEILASILAFKDRFLAQHAKILVFPPQILHQEIKKVVLVFLVVYLWRGRICRLTPLGKLDSGIAPFARQMMPFFCQTQPFQQI